MSKTLRLTRYLALTAAVASLVGLVIGLRTVTAKESPASDCLIAIQNADGDDVTSIECTDCDPSCDADTDNSAPNGQCSIRLRAVVNHPTSTCTGRDLKKAKVTPKKAGISVQPNGSGSADGAFTNVLLRLKGKKSKQKVLMLTAMAVANGTPKAADRDKVKVICKRQTAATCPTTTTTTTTTTLPTCGDGFVNGSEECDPSANPTGCGTGLVCVPTGTDACTCKDCAAPMAPTVLKFTTGTNVSTSCGGPSLEPPAEAPFAGSITVHDTVGGGNTTLNLGAGCLYIGGGGNASSPGVPGGVTPDGATSVLDVSLSCANNQLVVAPHNNTGDPLNRLSCTKGAGPAKSCINNIDTFPLTACNTDAECGGVAGACVPAPNCFFGPPLPISNGAVSTCVLNTFLSDGGGSINKTNGVAQLAFPLASNVFVTGNASDPCPRCQDLGMGLRCQAGTKFDQPCTPVGTQQTTLDCPPAGPYLPQFPVTLDPLTTGTAMKTNAGGIFCTGQDTEATTTPGAFGTSAADSTKIATQIQGIGAPAGDITDMATHSSTLTSVFCIPATGNGLIDGSAFLPGPGMVSLPGTVQLQ